MGRRNKSTFIPTETRVKARRIRKVMEAILTNPPDCDEARKEMEADLKFLDKIIYSVEMMFDCMGDNHTFDLATETLKEFEALEVKYIKAPKEALKGL
jgi:hypothetical protein